MKGKVAKMKVIEIALLLLTVKTSYGDPPNVALRGKATQSSRDSSDYGAAYNAIDGNRNPNFFDGSCASTKAQTNPWWRVDLLEKYVVTKIVVANRGDCCSEGLEGAEVRLGNSDNNNGNDNDVVAVLPNIAAGGTFTFDLPEYATIGRYVNVILPCVHRSLTLCEVEVYGYRDRTGENLALFGVATQSSTYLGGGSGDARNAIDGNRNAQYLKGSCQHTERDENPWWRLDLLKKHRIQDVVITNRAGSDTRLNGAEILVGNDLTNNGNSNPRCATITSIPAGATTSFSCNWMEGRYVNIVINRLEFLHVCEVEVFGLVLE